MIKFKFYKGEFDEKYEYVYRGVEDIKEKYYALDKRMEVIGIRIDALRAEMNEKFNGWKKDL